MRKGECAAAVKVKSIFASIYSTMRLTEEMRKPSQFTGSGEISLSDFRTDDSVVQKIFFELSICK